MADTTGWGLGSGNAPVSGAQQEYWFSLKLRVDSPEQLWQAAALRCLSQSNLSPAEVEEIIGPIEDPSVSDCLMILALPERIPGCSRLDTILAHTRPDGDRTSPDVEPVSILD